MHIFKKKYNVPFSVVLLGALMLLVPPALASTHTDNPHAVTSVHGHTYTYDHNGNLTTDGTRTNTWDYKNMLTQTDTASTTVTYAYDHAGTRVKLTGTATTYTPSRYYEETGTSSKRHIYLGDDLLATLDISNGTTTPLYVHRDHLGSTHVVSKDDQSVAERITYYPFGGIRTDDTYGPSSERKKFTGHEYDDDTGLYYMQARYQDPEVGRFVSQDPAFLAVGTSELAEIMSNAGGKSQQISTSDQALRILLTDPQGVNSYSYSRNNPLLLVDRNGEWYVDIGGSLAVGPFQAGVGIRVNNEGAVFYYSAGAGFGLMLTGPEFNSGEINVDEPELTVSHDAGFAGGPGINTSYESVFDPKHSLSVGTNGKQSYGVTAGLGGRVNQTYTQSIPIYSSASHKSSCLNCSTKSSTSNVKSSSMTSSSNRTQSSKSTASKPTTSSSVWSIIKTAVSRYYAGGGK